MVNLSENGRKAMICSIYIIIIIDNYHTIFALYILVNIYLVRAKRSCARILRKTVSYEWNISHDGRSILFQVLEQRRASVTSLDSCIMKIYSFVTGTTEFPVSSLSRATIVYFRPGHPLLYCDCMEESLVFIYHLLV